MESRTLLRIGTSQTDYQDVFEQDLTPPQKRALRLGRLQTLAERMADVPVVCSYLTNGVELLAKHGQPKKTEWPGSRIPFKACYGRIVYTSNDSTQPVATGSSGAEGMARKEILSYIRLARHAQKYYNYLKSSEGERFKMNLLVPYMAYEGQLSPENLLALQASVSTPVPVVLVKPTAELTGDAVLPLPRRELNTLDVQGYEIAAEAARRDIQNALGRASVSDPRCGTRHVESGVGLQELQKTGDQS